MKWTTDQQAAIDAPKPGSLPSQTLLVAAAAGSGKTAVLVERIIARLQDKENPLSVQDLLVVTFTKAAAAEMSARIGAKLAEEFDRTGDEYLEQQLKLLPSAHISTLHSFCQWVIRSYFYRLDMDPSFRIGNEGELSLLRREVLDRLFLEAYGSGSWHIYDLAEMFSDDRSDDSLKQNVLRLYDFSRAQAMPELWLRRAKEQYQEAAGEELLHTLWGKAVWTEQQEALEELRRDRDQLEQLMLQPTGPAEMMNYAEELEALLVPMEQAKSWDEMVSAVCQAKDYEFLRWSEPKAIREGKKTGLVSEGLITQAKALRDSLKKRIQAMGEGLFAIDSKTWQEQIAGQLPLAEGLTDMTLAFGKAYEEAKQEAGMIDFSDLEHFCLNLLVKPGTGETGEPEPSEAALELQQMFREVMVDEYQDTNGVQEAIIKLVSCRDNRFYVGDVKQSIYRFRMADPGLFMAKYHRFGRKVEDVERRIDLAQNFRSDANILSFTNFIFRQVMTEEGAELAYGDEEALNPGRIVKDAPPDWVGGPVELHLLETGGRSRAAAQPEQELGEEAAEEDDPEELAKDEQEMQCIIEQLKRLKQQKVKVQEKDGTFREMRWRDVVILLRSLSGKANRMVEAFRNAGIPAYAEENGGYFSSLEVQLVLSLLQVIDNPEQDLPMAAVLRSPLAGLEGNELGRLRMSGEGSLWQLLPAYAKSRQQEQQDSSLVDFVEQLEKWRTLSRRRGVAELLQVIFEETRLVEYVSAMPNGAVRRANILALHERARQYEAGSFRGLFRFLRFVENLQAAGQDLSVAGTVSEADDVVRIMSIHKSKGLEFPVVFLSSVQKGFNLMDLRNTMLLHQEYGIGLKGYYPEWKVLYPSLPWLADKRRLELAAKAEEERILYVALTRARDKLFITGTVNSREACGKRLAPALLAETEALPKHLVTGARSFMDWILPPLGRHLDGNVLKEAAGVEEIIQPALKDRECRFTITFYPEGTWRTAASQAAANEADLKVLRELLPREGGGVLPEEIRERLTFVYPHQQAVAVPAKISVSEIKRRFAEQEEEAEAETYADYASRTEDAAGYADKTEGNDDYAGKAESQASNADQANSTIYTAKNSVFEQVPACLAELEGESAPSGARRGTLIHTALQWLPLQNYTEAGLTAALDQLEKKNLVTDEERKLLPDRAIWQFFAGSLGRRMLASDRVERELPFSMLIEADRVYPGVGSEEQVFLQGILDAAFLEDDQWVLVDYKTDRVQTGEELLRRYRIQLQLYKEALERLTGISVKEACMYSFALGESVPVQ